MDHQEPLAMFQSRPGFSDRCDHPSIAPAPPSLSVFQSRPGFSDRCDQRPPRRRASFRPSFNPVLGFLTAATAVTVGCGRSRLLFQSRPGFSDRCDRGAKRGYVSYNGLSIHHFRPAVRRPGSYTGFKKVDENLPVSGFREQPPGWGYVYVLRPAAALGCDQPAVLEHVDVSGYRTRVVFGLTGEFGNR